MQGSISIEFKVNNNNNNNNNNTEKKKNTDFKRIFIEIINDKIIEKKYILTLTAKTVIL